MFKTLRSFPLQLLTFVALPLMVILVIVSFSGVSLHQNSMRDLVAERDVRAVRTAADSLSERLNQRIVTLRTLAENYAQSGDMDAIFANQPSPVQMGFSDGIALYDSEMTLLDGVGNYTDWQAIVEGEKIGSLAHMGQEPIFIHPNSQQAEQRRVLLVVPGETENIHAAGMFTLDDLDVPGVLSELLTSEGSNALLVTDEEVALFSTNASDLDGLVSTLSIPSLQGESGANYTQEQVIAFDSVQPAGWILLVVEPWREVVSPIMRFSLAAPLLLIPGLLVAASAVYFGAERVVKPLQRLERQAIALGWGDYSAIGEPVGGIDEISQLQTTLRRMANQIRDTQTGMRNYITAITRGQEDERARLARELHDQMVQTLIALNHRLQMLDRYIAPEGVERLADVTGMTDDAIKELRRIVGAMRPIYLEDLGLVPALDMLAHGADERHDAAVSFAVEGTARRMEPEQELALYRIAQEALNNAIRHANAQHVNLTIKFAPGSTAVTVKDDGRGFAAPERVSELGLRGHWGLVGMQERAALIGARFVIESTQGSGTTIAVNVQMD